MDYELNDEQYGLRAAVDTLLERHAGPERARELDGQGDADAALAAALASAGFLDLAREPEAGALCAELVTEWVAREAGVVPIGARTLVAPAVTDEPLPDMVAVMEEGFTGPVRFAAHAQFIVVIGESEARVVAPAAGGIAPVRTVYGYPMARVSPDGAEVVATGDAAVARRWWQVALAAEIAGTMEAAFALTLQHHKTRTQFGRPIGSHQALQHRMSELYVRSQGAAWLAREAAYHGADAERAAAAATYATEGAARAGVELHQMTGAIGFTREYDLHIWSLRLQALRLEMGGTQRHASALAGARWP